MWANASKYALKHKPAPTKPQAAVVAPVAQPAAQPASSKPLTTTKARSWFADTKASVYETELPAHARSVRPVTSGRFSGVHAPQLRPVSALTPAKRAASDDATPDSTPHEKVNRTTNAIQSPFKKEQVTPATGGGGDDDSALWVNVLAPTRVADVVGNQRAKEKVLEWFRRRQEHVQRVATQKTMTTSATSAKHHYGAGVVAEPLPKVLLLTGPPGIAKTTLATLACKEYGYEVVEQNASDARTADRIVTSIRQSAMSYDLAGNGKALIVDEFDGMYEGECTKHGIDDIVHCIQHALQHKHGPVIFIANDTKPLHVRTLRKHACAVPMYALDRRDLYTLFHRAWKEKCSSQQCPQFVVQEFINMAGGDARRLLTAMQAFFSMYAAEIKGGVTSHTSLKWRAMVARFVGSSAKDVQSNVFESTRNVLYGRSDDARVESDTLFDKDAELTVASLFENYPSGIKTAMTRVQDNLNAGGARVRILETFETQVAMMRALSDADVMCAHAFPPDGVVLGCARSVSIAQARALQRPASSRPQRPDIKFPLRVLGTKETRTATARMASLRTITSTILSAVESMQYRDVYMRATDRTTLAALEKTSRLKDVHLHDYLFETTKIGANVVEPELGGGGVRRPPPPHRPAYQHRRPSSYKRK